MLVTLLQRNRTNKGCVCVCVCVYVCKIETGWLIDCKKLVQAVVEAGKSKSWRLEAHGGAAFCFQRQMAGRIPLLWKTSV